MDPSPEGYSSIAKDDGNEHKEENCGKQASNPEPKPRKGNAIHNFFFNLKSKYCSQKSESLPDADVVDQSPLQMLVNPNFYLLYIILFTEGIPLTFVVTLYKVFGQSLIDNDHFLTAAGSVSAVFNLLGRILWGALADKTSYELALVLQSATMCFLLYTFYSVSVLSPALYFIWLCGICFCIGGLFCLLIVAVASAFGQKYVGINFGILYTSRMVGSILAAFVVGLLERVVGWDWIFVVSGGVATIAYTSLIISLFYQHIVYPLLKSEPCN